MNMKKFLRKLSRVDRVADNKKQSFQEISIENNYLNITLRSDEISKIDIAKLYELFRKYDIINESEMSKDLELTDPNAINVIIEIFKAAGLYNKNGFKKGLKRWLKRSALTKRFVAFIPLGLPVLTIILAIWFYSPDSTSNWAKAVISITMAVINISFFIFLWFNRKGESEDVTYSALFSLMIFNIGIFPLFNYIKDYKDKNSDKVQYTIGLRAWGSEVEFYDIKVNYYDKDGNPYSLPNEVVNDSNFWKTGEVWEKDNNPNKLENANYKFLVDTSRLLHLRIKNGGVLLDQKKLSSKNKAFLKARDYYVEAKFIFIHTDPFYIKRKLSEQYQSVQICLKVPINPENKEASNIYYAFEYPLMHFNWSKLRIPGFNFDYVDAQLYHRMINGPNDREATKVSASIDSTIFKNYYSLTDAAAIDKKLKNDTIRFSALLLDQNVSFNIFEKEYSHSLPLFNFNIKKYGAFTLEEK